MVGGLFFQEGRVVNLQTLFPQYKELAGNIYFGYQAIRHNHIARHVGGERWGDCPFLVTDISHKFTYIKINFERFVQQVFRLVLKINEKISIIYT